MADNEKHGFLEDDVGNRSSLRLIAVTIGIFFCAWGTIVVIGNIKNPTVNFQWAVQIFKEAKDALYVLFGVKGAQTILQGKVGEVIRGMLSNKQTDKTDDKNEVKQ